MWSNPATFGAPEVFLVDWLKTAVPAGVLVSTQRPADLADKATLVVAKVRAFPRDETDGAEAAVSLVIYGSVDDSYCADSKRLAEDLLVKLAEEAEDVENPLSNGELTLTAVSGVNGPYEVATNPRPEVLATCTVAVTGLYPQGE